MAESNTRKVLTVEETWQKGGEVNQSNLFDKCWAAVQAMRDKILARLPAKIHPSCEPFRTYKGVGEAYGQMTTYTADLTTNNNNSSNNSSAIDYMTCSFLANPQRGFSNIHLNVYLSPEIDVPHLGIVFGSFPDLFYFLDTVPRRDLQYDMEYLDKYYSDASGPGKCFLDFHNDDRFKAFTSIDYFTRAQISPCGVCINCPASDDRVDFAIAEANKRIDLWLSWIESAQKVPEPERPALAYRDWFYRKNVVQRDPANGLAGKVIGDDLAKKLIAVMWGETHVNKYLQVGRVAEEKKKDDRRKAMSASTAATAPVAAATAPVAAAPAGTVIISRGYGSYYPAPATATGPIAAGYPFSAGVSYSQQPHPAYFYPPAVAYPVIRK